MESVLERQLAEKGKDSVAGAWLYMRACGGETHFQLLQPPGLDDAWNESARWLTGFSSTPLFESLSASGLGLTAAAEPINYGTVGGW